MQNDKISVLVFDFDRVQVSRSNQTKCGMLQPRSCSPLGALHIAKPSPVPSILLHRGYKFEGTVFSKYEIGVLAVMFHQLHF